MTYPQTTPYSPSALDTVLYAQNLADSIMRNNPLVNAIVPKGLMKWYGNYQNPDGSPVNFLWIGEFLPADPNMAGRPQKGFSLVRDDSTHSSAIAMLDGNPGTPLKQTLTLSSYDGKPMLSESRNTGGISFPRNYFAMWPNSLQLPAWPQVFTGSRNLWGGQVSATGHIVGVTMQIVTDAGVSGTCQMRIDDGNGNGTLLGSVHSVGGSANSTFYEEIDITSLRGLKSINVYVDASQTAGTGGVYVLVHNAVCYSS